MVGSRKRGGGPGEDQSVAKIANVNGGMVVDSASDGGSIVPVAASTAVETHSEVAAALVPVVTPARNPRESSKPMEKFYMMNIKVGKLEEFTTFEIAKKCKDMLVSHNPKLEQFLIVQEFKTEKEARSYLNIYKKLGDFDDLDAASEDGSVGMKLPAVVNAGRSAASPSVTVPGPPNNASDGTGAGGGVTVVNDGDDLFNDDDVPFNAVGNETVRPPQASESPQMNAFAAATIGTGTSIVVLRWRLPGAKYHIYAFKLMDGPEQYWSHKPQMWMHAVQTERDAPLYAPPSTFTLHRAMNRCNAAGIRAVPCGDSTILTIKTKRTAKVIDQYLLYGFVSEAKTNDDISEMIRSFVRHCAKPEVRTAYFVTIRELMNSAAISDDCKPTGKYWIKLASGANNIVFMERRFLSEVFLDQDIQTIVNLAYKTPGESPHSWPPHVRMAAFGPSSGAA